MAVGSSEESPHGDLHRSEGHRQIDADLSTVCATTQLSELVVAGIGASHHPTCRLFIPDLVVFDATCGSNPAARSIARHALVS
jgi:hypothetical protein